MKSRIYLFLLLISSLLFVQCKSETTQENKTQSSAESTEVTNERQGQAFIEDDEPGEGFRQAAVGQARGGGQRRPPPDPAPGRAALPGLVLQGPLPSQKDLLQRRGDPARLCPPRA